MRKIWRGLFEEGGNAVILLAVGFSVLLGFAALAVDGGVLYLEHTRLARAADAAVLAGAQELPDAAEARSRAVDYAQRNGVETGDPNYFTVQFSADNKQIAVNIKEEVDLFFARALGVDSSTVNGRAVARIAPVRRVRGVIPVGLNESLLPLSVGQQYTIKVGSRDLATGWSGILEYPGQSGAEDYRTTAYLGYTEPVEVGDQIAKASGNKSGPTIQGINDRISTSLETWDNFQPDSTRVAIVPIYEVLGSQPSDKIKIKGFAAVFLEQVIGNGNVNEIKVRYINYTIIGDTDDSLATSPLNGVRLVE